MQRGAGVEVEFPVLDDRLVQGEHQQPAAQRAAHGREAGGGDLLEDRHDEAEGAPLIALPVRQREPLLQVLAQRAVEGTLGVGHGERLGVHPAAREQRRSVRAAGVGLGAAQHDRIEAMALRHHLAGAGEQGRVQELHQHPEAEVVALMRRGRQQDQIAGVALQRLGQLVVRGLAHRTAGALRRQVVRFVEHHQVPARRGKQAPHPGAPLQGIDAGDEPVVPGERVRLAVGDVALAAEHLELQVEDLVEFPVPVVDQPGRHHHQGAAQLAAAGQLAQHQRDLDRLAQAHFVGDQVAPRRGGGDPVGQDDLMREQVDRRRGQRRGALHQRQRMRLACQPRLPQARRAPLHAGQHALGARQGRQGGGGRDLPFAVAEEYPQVPVTRRADHHPIAELGMPYPRAGRELRGLAGGVRHERRGW